MNFTGFPYSVEIIISTILGIVMSSMLTIMPLNAEKTIFVEKVENNVRSGGSSAPAPAPAPAPKADDVKTTKPKW